MIEKTNHIKSWINSITNNITLRLVLKTRMHREQNISLSTSDLYQPKSHIGYIFTSVITHAGPYYLSFNLYFFGGGGMSTLNFEFYEIDKTLSISIYQCHIHCLPLVQT